MIKKDYYKPNLQNMPKEIDIRHSTVDSERIQEMEQPFQETLHLYKVKPENFVQYLKDYSKTSITPKGILAKVINKNDLWSAVQIMQKLSKCKIALKLRDFKRSSTDVKNVVFTYFALEYPSMMHEIATNEFQAFPFCDRLHDKHNLAIKWDECINKLQEIKRNLLLSKEDYMMFQDPFDDDDFTQFDHIDMTVDEESSSFFSNTSQLNQF